MASGKEINSGTAGEVVTLEPLSDKGISVHPKTLARWYQTLHLGRLIDMRAATYVRQAKGWSYHSSCAGHEGIQLILGLSFRQGKDFLFPYYRDMMTCLAAGLSVQEIIENGLSKPSDVGSGGRHMSNHLSKPSIRIQNVSSATGNHSLHAAGVARAIKSYNGDEIAFASFGESAVSEGFVYEAISGAAREILPVIFVIQNNKFGISVPINEESANENVAKNFEGFKTVKIVSCDGTNVFDTKRATARRSFTPIACASTPTAIPTGRRRTVPPKRSRKRSGSTPWPDSGITSLRKRAAPKPSLT